VILCHSAVLLVRQEAACDIALQCERARVAISATARVNGGELGDLALTCLDNWLRWTHSIFARRMQYGLTALMLVLVQRVESDGCGASAP